MYVIPFSTKTREISPLNSYSMGYRLIDKSSSSTVDYELVYVHNKINTIVNRFLAREFSIGPLKGVEFDQSFISNLFEKVKFPPIENLHRLPNTLFKVKYAGPSVAYLSKKNRKSNTLFTKIITEAFNFKTNCLKPKFLQNKLLAIHKDINGAHLTTIERKHYTLFNRLIALFGLGPLAKLDLKISSIAKYYLDNLKRRPDHFDPKIVTYFAYQAAKKGSFDLLLHIKINLFINYNFTIIDKLYGPLLLPEYPSIIKQGEVFGDNKQKLTWILHFFSKEDREQVVKVFKAINDINFHLSIKDKENLLKTLRVFPVKYFSELIYYIQTTKDINFEGILKKILITHEISKLEPAKKVIKDFTLALNELKELNSKTHSKKFDKLKILSDLSSNCIESIDKLQSRKALKEKFINLYFEKMDIKFDDDIYPLIGLASICEALTRHIDNLNEDDANELIEKILPNIDQDIKPNFQLPRFRSDLDIYNVYKKAYESTLNQNKSESTV